MPTSAVSISPDKTYRQTLNSLYGNPSILSTLMLQGTLRFNRRG